MVPFFRDKVKNSSTVNLSVNRTSNRMVLSRHQVHSAKLFLDLFGKTFSISQISADTMKDWPGSIGHIHLVKVHRHDGTQQLGGMATGWDGNRYEY